MSNPRRVNLDNTIFSKCLSSAPSGSAPGPGGCTYEMLKVCLGDAEATHLLFRAAEDLARAEAPEPITRAFMSATMTALSKPDGGVRGIATGTSFRRLVAKTLARQFMKVVESTCAPFQFALSTRAGTDCVGHTIRAMTDDDPECTVLSIDGIGAYDHILRSAFLTKLHQRARTPRPLAVCPVNSRQEHQLRLGRQPWRETPDCPSGGRRAGRSTDAPPVQLGHSRFVARSQRADETRRRVVCVSGRRAGRSTSRQYQRSVQPRGSRTSCWAGIRLNIGKTRTWNRDGTRPPDLDDLGEDAWDPEGIKIPFTPIGSDDFVQRVLNRRLEDEAKLWTALTWVCAGPRCHHLLRTLPPSQSLEHATRHDEGMMQAMDNLLGGLTGGADEKKVAHHVASLPMRLGGLGLRSARRMAAGAYWSSWADALAMIHQRLPRVANSITEKLEGVVAARGCLTELREVADRLDRQGFVGRPGWGELKLGARPPPAHTVEPGEWAHGWQYHASSASEYHFRETVVLPQSSASHQAHLRSHSGGGSSNVLHGCPTSSEFTVEAALFRTLVLERLRLPLAVTEGRCECGDWVDSKGWHRAACIQDDCAQGQRHRRELWPESCVKLEPPCVSTACSGR